MRKILFLMGAMAVAGGIPAWGESGDSVVVVYNSRMKESKAVAIHYAERRHVPMEQILPLDLPATETMTRQEFRDKLETPMWKWLEEKNLFTVKSVPDPTTNNAPLGRHWKVTEAKVRYAVLCYGVPSRILRDASLKEPGMEKLKDELKRNEAAVDSELALLPLHDLKLPLTGPLQNIFYLTTNSITLNPTNGILMVARLDGPTPEIARGLVDKAMDAETNGLWGRFYFDLRGVTNEYRLGDDWLRQAVELSQHLGFESVVDEKPETFSASFPMSQTAVYAGWYDAEFSGPFRSGSVEFMPGAFAYHLHSFSAATLRATDKNWVGPLLAQGATITMGCVDEPYLSGTPDIGTFLTRFIFFGFSFGEAASASQTVYSWQTTVVGDPLYRPFGKNPQWVHEELLRRKSRLIEWSHLRVVNLNLAQRYPVAECINYLEQIPETKQSAVLEEKLGDLYQMQGKPASSIHAYKMALGAQPSRVQQTRLYLVLADKLTAAGEEKEAMELYEEFLKKTPTYAEPLAIYKKLFALAEKLQKSEDAARFKKEMDRLSPAAKAQ